MILFKKFSENGLNLAKISLKFVPIFNNFITLDLISILHEFRKLNFR